MRLTQTILAVAALALATTVHAAGTAEHQCQKAHYDAKAKYGACQEKALAMHYIVAADYNLAMGKCATKYRAVWPKLEAKFAGQGVTCDQTRFSFDSDVVRDRLTGLEWVVTTDDGTVRDKDNTYTYNAGGPNYWETTGTVFTSYLQSLNTGGCYAAQCDWRLPTVAELQTILNDPYPCNQNPCISTAVFGPVAATPGYWASTTLATTPSLVSVVVFDDGVVFFTNKSPNARYARAVRADW
jgi:hypothetical protein